MSERRSYDADQDRAVEESFPASDPPSTTPTQGPGDAGGSKSAGLEEEADPKGRPTSDRQAAETTAGRVEGHPVAQHKSE